MSNDEDKNKKYDLKERIKGNKILVKNDGQSRTRNKKRIKKTLARSE